MVGKLNLWWYIYHKQDTLYEEKVVIEGIQKDGNMTMVVELMVVNGNAKSKVNGRLKKKKQ